MTDNTHEPTLLEAVERLLALGHYETENDRPYSACMACGRLSPDGCKDDCPWLAVEKAVEREKARVKSLCMCEHSKEKHSVEKYICTELYCGCEYFMVKR